MPENKLSKRVLKSFLIYFVCETVTVLRTATMSAKTYLQSFFCLEKNIVKKVRLS